MPTKRQRQLQDGKEMTLGGLFLVDNAPERPEEMSWHDFSNKAIAEHLERHSYYCTEKGKRDLVTVAKMRSRINNMCNNYAKPTMPKPNKLGRESKDKVDVLFGFGRSELLKKDFLDLLGYEKGSFPQSRLNKHVSEVDTSGEASIARRPEDTPASAKTGGRPEGEMAEENHGSGISKTSSRDAGEDERRESEAGVAAPPSVQPTLPPFTSDVGTPPQPPENANARLESSMVGDRERHEQNEPTSDEQLPSSQDEGRRLRSSVDPRAQSLSADNNPSFANEKANPTSSKDQLGLQKESVRGAKRKPTQDHGPHKRQCQTKATTFQNNSNVLRLRLKAPTPAKQPSKPPPTIDASKGPETPQNAIASRENQVEPCLAILSLDEQGRNMQSLYETIQKATNAILSSIGPIRHFPSPLHPESSGPLKDLYARCWGSRWEEVRVRQIGDHVFTTPHVTESLLSAFLYDRILTPRVQLEELVSNVLEMGGSVGEALLEELDIATRGQSDHFSNEHAYIELTRFRYHNR